MTSMFSYFEDPINLNGLTMGFLDGSEVWITTDLISIDFIRDARVMYGQSTDQGIEYLRKSLKNINAEKADLKKIDEIISKMTDDNHIKSSLILLRGEIRDNKINNILK